MRITSIPAEILPQELLLVENRLTGEKFGVKSQKFCSAKFWLFTPNFSL
jgi:hypothetical protein